MQITVENMDQFHDLRSMLLEFIRKNPAERVYVRVGKIF